MGLFSRAKRWIPFVVSSARKRAAKKRVAVPKKKKAAKPHYRDLDALRLWGAVMGLAKLKPYKPILISALAEDVEAPVDVVRERLERRPDMFLVQGGRVSVGESPSSGVRPSKPPPAKPAPAKHYRDLDALRLWGAVMGLAKLKPYTPILISALAEDVEAPAAVVKERLERRPDMFLVQGGRVSVGESPSSGVRPSKRTQV